MRDYTPLCSTDGICPALGHIETKGETMQHMDEIEFHKLTKSIPESVEASCTHRNIVRLYDKGAHSDYGCLTCGACGTKEALERVGERNGRS